MKRPLTDHEYQVNGGAWIGCTTSNCTDHGDGTYTITDGLDVDIPIGQLKVRVKALGDNPASAELLNSAAFNASTARNYQIIFIGDSISAGVGTTTSGSSASGDFNGGNDFPSQALTHLTGLTISKQIMPFPGRSADWFNNNAIHDAILLFDKVNHTDIYCIVEFGANDLGIGGEGLAIYKTAIALTCATLKAAGAKVILTPILNRKDDFAGGSFAADRNNANSWLVANYITIGADALVDYSNHPEIFSDTAPDNATYFNTVDADGLTKVHPTDVGAAIIGTCVATSITMLSTTASLAITLPDEAADFITAAGITDSTQIAAVTTLVSDLKSAGLWWKLRAIYPFVGGTSSAHKFNLRNAVDSDSAYRLTYYNTPTHDANGITFADDSKADTKFTQNQQSAFTFGNISLHYYSRTANASPEGVDMGMGTGSVLRLGFRLGSQSYTEVNQSGGSGVGESYLNGLGFFSTARANNLNLRSFYRNGVLIRDTADAATNTPLGTLLIGDQNLTGSNSYPSNRNCAYAAFGYGLTAVEEATHYTIVQAYQTALGRNV
jgi:lysophospholipase L1-like esterase